MRHQAIYNLYPQAVTVTDEYGAYDSDGQAILLNESAIAQEIARLLQQYQATEYQRLRAAAYPPITDYLDAVVKADQAQIDKYIQDCLAVKAQYPKPE